MRRERERSVFNRFQGVNDGKRDYFIMCCFMGEFLEICLPFGMRRNLFCSTECRKSRHSSALPCSLNAQHKKPQDTISLPVLYELNRFFSSGQTLILVEKVSEGIVDCRSGQRRLLNKRISAISMRQLGKWQADPVNGKFTECFGFIFTYPSGKEYIESVEQNLKGDKARGPIRFVTAS